MSIIKVEAPAKVNMALSVTGKRPDGYHDMRMINFSVDLMDVLTIRPSDKLTLRCDDAQVPTDGSNLIMKVAQKLQKQYHVKDGADIYLEKNIPMQAGLAGGSADAAAAIIGLCELWQLQMSEAQQCRFGVRFGADIPYCLVNTPALVEGIGEKVTELETFPKLAVLGVKPAVDIPTPKAFAAFDKQLKKPDGAWMNDLLDAINRDDLDAIAKNTHNDFEPLVFEKYPQVRDIKEKLIDLGATFAVMSGSGSTVIGYFKTMGEAKKALTAFKSAYPIVFTANINL